MKRQDDPNPLDDAESQCGQCENGTVRLNEAGDTFFCDRCDWVMSYEECKNVDMFVRHLQEQYPDVSREEMLQALDEMDEEEAGEE